MTVSRTARAGRALRGARPRQPALWSPDIGALRAFATLVAERRFARAARTLAVSPSALSRQIQRLEEELGAPLVVRSANEVTPTRAGAVLLGHVTRVLSTLDAARANVTALARSPAGVVTAGTIVSVGSSVLTAVVTPFRERHPDVSIELREGVSDALEELLVAGTIDFAILGRRPRRPELVARTLWREDYAVVTAPDHPLARAGAPVSAAEVAREPLVVAPGWPVDALFELTGEPGGATRRVLICTDNLETVRRLVEAGSGISLVPAMLLERGPAWHVVRIATTFRALQREVTLAHRGASQLTAAAIALIHAIELEAASTR